MYFNSVEEQVIMMKRISDLLLKIALIMMVLYVFILFSLSLFRIVSGDFSQWVYLAPGALMLVQAMFVRRNPLLSSITMIVLGSILTAFYYVRISSPEEKTITAIVLGGTFIFCGLLVLISFLLNKIHTTNDDDL
jgi:hypothetical protein